MKIKQYLILAVLLIAICVAAFIGVRSIFAESGAGTETEERTQMTPVVIDSIRSIGQWELASIELTTTIDTVQKRWMGLVKDKVRCSYQGRMSVGIDMKTLPEKWYHTDKDTIFLRYPDICLLDSNFIDESMTRVVLSENDDFAQNAKVKKGMLEKARSRMIKEGITSLVVAECKEKAVRETTERFKAIGYKNVVVDFGTDGAKE